MNNVTLTTKIISRNDTALNWRTVNPVLTKGEMGIEIDTRKIKFGDGVANWNDLVYANVLPSEIEGFGFGDMKSEVYDTNGNGKVDRAELSDEATVAGKLKTPVTIAGVSFDGSANISIPKANIGLGNVDNTSDANKPVSTATQSALNAIKGNAGSGVTLGTVDTKATTNAGNITTVQGKVTTLETKVDVPKVSTAISSAITASEAKLGTSASKNVGTSAGSVVEVGSDGKIASSIIPSIAITDTFLADSEAKMLALTKAEKGDVCIRTDIKETFILMESGYNTLSNWKKLETPTDKVSSVNGQTGVVTLNSGHISEGSNLYYTEARVSANFRTQSSANLTDGNTILHSTDVLILNGGNA